MIIRAKIFATSILFGGLCDSFAVDGFTVAADGGNFSQNLYGGYGKVVRIEIKNSKPGEKTTLYEGGARFARISQDGKRIAFICKNKDIMVMNADGSGPPKKVGAAAVSAQGYLAWVNSNTIYFSDGGYSDNGSKVIHSVGADGTHLKKNLATFDYKLWVWGISADGSHGTVRPSDSEQGDCGGHAMGDVYKITLPGKVTLNCESEDMLDNQGCGNAISPKGQYISFFGSTDHAVIGIKNWSGGSEAAINTRDFYQTRQRNNRTRWSANSEHWLCTYYDNSRQVLINWKTGECIKVNSGGSRMPGDFWIGGQTGRVSPVVNQGAMAFTVRQGPGGVLYLHFNNPFGDASRLRVWSLEGRLLGESAITGQLARLRGLPQGMVIADVAQKGKRMRKKKFLIP